MLNTYRLPPPKKKTKLLVRLRAPVQYSSTRIICNEDVVMQSLDAFVVGHINRPVNKQCVYDVQTRDKDQGRFPNRTPTTVVV